MKISINDNIKTLLACAGGIYGVIAVSAIIVYFMLPHVVPPGTFPDEGAVENPAAVAVDEPKEKTSEELLKNLPPDTPEKTAADKEKEEQEKQKAKERQEKNEEAVKQRTVASWSNDRNFRELIKGMKETVRGNVTFFTHNYSSKPLSGVYIRPFVIKGKSDAIVKNDIYYYVTTDDDKFNWIHGDTVNITADGYTYVWSFDPSKRHDKLAKSAEEIMENYVETASESRIRDLKAIGNASNVTVYYYNSATGTGRTSPLSRENIRNIRDMIKLYELFTGTPQEGEG